MFVRDPKGLGLILCVLNLNCGKLFVFCLICSGSFVGLVFWVKKKEGEENGMPNFVFFEVERFLISGFLWLWGSRVASVHTELMSGTTWIGFRSKQCFVIGTWKFII